MSGPLFEGLIVSDVWKTFFNMGKRPSAYFWRAQDGHEVDLIIQAAGKFWPIEIKLTSTPSTYHLKPLNRFKEIAGNEAGERGILVCNVDKKINLPGNNIAVPWFLFSNWLMELIK